MPKSWRRHGDDALEKLGACCCVGGDLLIIQLTFFSCVQFFIGDRKIQADT